MQDRAGDHEQRPDAPRVAVIIPAYNAERFIRLCLDGIRDLDYPRDHIEVVVVDNGSVDRTREIAVAHGVRVLDLPVGLVGAVRNHGVKATTSDYLAFIDSDCVPGRDWLKRAVALLGADAELGGVGGICLAPATASWIERAWAQNRHADLRERASLAASSLIVRRRDFETVGGFDERMSAGEDYELSRRLRSCGLRLVAVPECAVYHWGWPRTFAEVYRRQVWQGSNQLRAAKGPLDPSLLLVHLFVLAPLLGVLLSLVLGPASPLAWSPLLLNLAIPGLASVHRSRASASLGRRLVKAARLYPVFWAYYLGRSVGLVQNYAGLVRTSPARTAKTWGRHATRAERERDDHTAD